MSDLTRASALKRLVGIATMPAALPDTRYDSAVIQPELRAVYENMIWAFAPMLDSAVPGQFIKVEPFMETRRRLEVLAEALEG